MTDIFVRKLETFSPLSEDDRRFIASVTRRFDLVSAETDIIREGDEPTDVRLIETGLAFRYKLLHRGQRQIVGFLFPGDICDLHAALLDSMDHSIAALSASRVVRISRSDIAALLERPAIARALLMVTLVNESIARDWLANVGGRRSLQSLRSEKLIILRNRRLTILDAARLRHVGGFASTYMHIKNFKSGPNGT